MDGESEVKVDERIEALQSRAFTSDGFCMKNDSGSTTVTVIFLSIDDHVARMTDPDEGTQIMAVTGLRKLLSRESNNIVFDFCNVDYKVMCITQKSLRLTR